MHDHYDEKRKTGDFVQREDVREAVRKMQTRQHVEAVIRPSEGGTLDTITDRILSAMRAAHEIGARLHQHADDVHGCVPTDASSKDGVPDRSPAAIQRIFRALDDLDKAMQYVGEAAGRNCTLA